MRSIGREVEFERVNARIDSLKTGSSSKVHFAVVAPQHGGLSLFLTDIAEKRLEVGDIVLSSTISDSLSIEEALSKIAFEFAGAVGDVASDGSLETLLRLGRRLRAQSHNKIAVLILDIAPALRGILENPQLRRSAKSNPLLQKLRTLVNLLQNHEPPIAIIVGWDDRFRSSARDWGVGDIVQRYAVEMLFADFGVGRSAWPAYRSIFKAAGLEVGGEYPGICGSKLPAGAFVAEARRLNQTVINGDFLLAVLSGRVPEADRERLNQLDKSKLETLCLSDKQIDIDPRIGTLAQPSDGGGYIASSELYNLLGLTPPREIVSFEERIRLRLADGDPDLPTEVANGIASVLATGDAPPRADGGIAFKLKEHFIPEPLRELEILLLWSFAVVPDPALVQAASAWIAEGETKPELGIRRLLVLLHLDPALRNGFGRAVRTALEGAGIQDPRPHGVTSSGRDTQARFLAGLLTVEIDVGKIVDAVWRTRDPNHSDELEQFLTHEIRAHYVSLARHMSRLSSDLISAESLQKLINGCGAPVEIGSTAGERLRRLGIATGVDGNRYIWRWRDDRLLQWFIASGPVDAGIAASDYLFAPSEWPQIASTIQVAYGDSLLKCSEDILSAADPLPLLQAQCAEARQQFTSACNNYMETAELDRQEFWRTRVDQISNQSPDDAVGYEDAIDEIWKANSELLDERNLAGEKHRAIQNELGELKKRLGDVTISTTELAEAKKRFDEKVDSALKQNQAPANLADQGRQLIGKLEQAVGQTKARDERAAPLEKEIEEFGRRSPELGSDVDKIRQEIGDPSIPVEQVASKFEKLKIRAESQARRPVQLEPSANPISREIFQNNDEDLARLATLYGHATIVAVDVE